MPYGVHVVAEERRATTAPRVWIIPPPPEMIVVMVPPPCERAVTHTTHTWEEIYVEVNGTKTYEEVQTPDINKSQDPDMRDTTTPLPNRIIRLPFYAANDTQLPHGTPAVHSNTAKPNSPPLPPSQPMCVFEI